MKGKWQQNLLRFAALLAVIAVSVFIFEIRDQAEKLAVYGYPGIFVLAFLAYATVLLPAPGVAVVFTMGAIFNPLFVALVAGAGAALGEITGYLLGYSSQALVERSSWYVRIEKWMERFGGLAVFLLAAVPNPFFDLAGTAAGTLKMPVWKFLIFCWCGETLKMVFFAYAGSSLLKFFG